MGGAEPERVLVLETVGTITDFQNAVRRIAGMEWMAEFDAEDILPDADFFERENPQERLRGRLFLVASNQDALRELLRLWNIYQVTPEEKFAYGYGKWKELFRHLHNIRVWGVEDRLRDTGVLRAWEEELREGVREQLFFEAELWYRRDEARQQRAEREFRRAVEASGGKVVNSAVLPQIAYHGVIGQLPSAAARRIIQGEQVQLLQCEDVMFVRASGQAVAHRPPDEPGPDEPGDGGVALAVPRPEPRLALLDGLPIQNHVVLRDRLIVDDPDGWGADYPANERVHGTAMASLIVQGDLERRRPPLSRPLYLRPIMRPDRRDFRSPRNEGIPHDTCVPDLIHRAVRRLFEQEGASPPVAPSVRVINLSIGDPFRPFDGTVSPFARILDWLSWKYGVLFLVSTGNYLQEVTISRTNAHRAELDAAALSEEIFSAVHQDAHIRRVLSPAESLNAITVGASHSDLTLGPFEAQRIDPYPGVIAPSPINATGPGFRRAIKPEVLFDGGRQLYSWKLAADNEPATLRPDQQTGRAPGVRVAAPSSIAGNLAATRYTRGTSNSTALGVHASDEILSAIDSLGNAIPPQRIGLLVKTLLVHGAAWGEDSRWLSPILERLHPGDNIREHVARYLGYGRTVVGGVIEGSDSRVTVIGTGELSDGDGNLYSFPLPPSLSSIRGRRRLTITLGWTSPVNAQHRNYRKAALWVSSPESPLLMNRTCADHQAVRRGTVQHEVFEGEYAVPFVDGDNITLKVNCREDAAKLVERVPYAIAVTLEVDEALAIPVYEEVRVRLRVAVPVRPA